MKSDRRVSNYFLFFAAWFFVGSVLVINGDRVLAILGLPQISYDIENQNSELLNQLFLWGENKPKDFTWYKVMVTQSTNNTPSGLNPVIESATAILGGYYEGHKVGILHQIRQYAHPEKLDDTYLDPRAEGSFSDVFASLDWLIISDIQTQRCVSSLDNSTLCHVSVVIGDKVINIEVNYQGSDPVQVKQLMNILLEAQLEKSK